MLQRLSRTDRRILETLQVEGQLSNVDLAARVGLSPSPCLRRVKALEADGVISGYVALLDRRKLGLDVVAFVEVQVDRHNDTVADAFRNAILRDPAVVTCQAMTGAFDYLLKVVVPNLDAYAEFTMKRLLKMPGVKDVRSSFVLETLKDSTALPLAQLDDR
ncbi:Lrp/AsnC family transcriptional regulator [Phenylobacterium montanum]|uniref:Lrp/AsnC family transcriptional regulator n=1 Tax=Phenylobacterium montanum TaxID=2823693 RepID=A0A975FXP7_9CAUL|nr:Lrp/AsnC family transcriptional regulator [Caulobacter sp. S6]QUD87388.1 Lrp/AsnC family transcriptional regulator [Caulobacter sp. S6]